jgi:hypothetical protein
VVLPEFGWMAEKIFGSARATCFTNGELATGKAEFSEPDEENTFCLNPNSELNGGSDVLCLAGAPGLTKERHRLPGDSHPSIFRKTLNCADLGHKPSY